MKHAKDLSPKETLEALRVCCTYGGTCYSCPLYVAPGQSDECYTQLVVHAADLLEALLPLPDEEV